MNILKSDLWKKRSLIYNFAISDLRVRYRNSVLGFFWTFLEPLMMLGVLYFVVSEVFKSRLEHFPIFILLGLIMWNMFARGTQIGLNSILNRSHLLTQIHLPKEIPALSSTLTALMMAFFEFIVFGFFIVIFQFAPPISILYLPLLVLLEGFLILGVSLSLSVLNIKYRDIQFIWGVVLQLGFFLTPIFYKFDTLPESMKNILQYSPMVQILTIAQNVSLYNIIPDQKSLTLVIGTVAVIFLVGYGIFRKFQGRIMEDL